MTRLSSVVAVVAIAVVALGGLFFINRPSEAVVGAPSASPSPSAPTSTPAVGRSRSHAELRYRWIGEPRDVGRGVSSRTGLNFSQDGYYLSGTTT